MRQLASTWQTKQDLIKLSPHIVFLSHTLTPYAHSTYQYAYMKVECEIAKGTKKKLEQVTKKLQVIKDIFLSQ